MSKYLKLDRISISLSPRVFSFNTEIHKFQISEVPLLWMEDRALLNSDLTLFLHLINTV